MNYVSKEDMLAILDGMVDSLEEQMNTDGDRPDEEKMKYTLLFARGLIDTADVPEPNTLELSDTDIDDIMVCALEGGINYWCSDVTIEGEFLAQWASDQISRGGKLLFEVDEPYEENEDGQDIVTYVLDKERFLNGWNFYLKERGTNSVTDENGDFDICMVDADIADQIVQYGLFWEVVYG